MLASSARHYGCHWFAVADGALAGLRRGDCFEAAIAEGWIVLTPIRVPTEATGHAKIAALGITEADAVDAVEWAR